MADRHHQTLGCFPWPLNLLGLHIALQILIDLLGRDTKRDLTKCCQGTFFKKILLRGFFGALHPNRLCRRADGASSSLGRNIDQIDLGRALE